MTNNLKYMVEIVYRLDTNLKLSKSFIIDNLFNLGRVIEEVRLSQTTYVPYLNIVDINIWII